MHRQPIRCIAGPVRCGRAARLPRAPAARVAATALTRKGAFICRVFVRCRRNIGCTLDSHRTPEQRKALTDLVVAATKSKAWQEDLTKNGWTPALLTGKAFDDFVDSEFASLRATMHLSGML